MLRRFNKKVELIKIRTANIRNIIDGLRRILNAYDGGSKYDVYEDVDIADIDAITPPKKTTTRKAAIFIPNNYGRTNATT